MSLSPQDSPVAVASDSSVLLSKIRQDLPYDYNPQIQGLKPDSFLSGAAKKTGASLLKTGKSYTDKQKWKALALSFIPKEIVKINTLQMQSTSQFYASNRKESTRSFAGSYIQYSLSSTADVAGIPLIIQLSVSTANGGPANNMTGLNVNFDYNGLLLKLKNQLSKTAEKEKKELEASLKNSALAGEIKGLKAILNSNRLLSVTSPASITDYTKKLPITDYKHILDPAYLDSSKAIAANGIDSVMPSMGNVDSLRQVYMSKVAQYKQMEAAYMGRINNLTKKIGQSPNVDEIIGALPLNGKQRAFYEQLMAVKAFQVGNITPSYSKLYLSGAGMQGLNFEYNRKLLYTAVVVGKSLNIAPLSFNREYTQSLGNGLFDFSRLNTMVRLGVGRKESSNLIFSTVYTRNSHDSITKNNVLLAMSGNLKLKEIALFKAEVAMSDIDKMKQHELSAGTYLYAKAAWTASMILHVPKALSKVSLEYTHTGAGFNSASQPFLRSDRDEVKTKVEQPFFKNKLKATALFNYQQTNTQGQDKPKYTFYTYGGDIQLLLPRLPMIKVGVLNYIAKTDMVPVEGTAPQGNSFLNVYALLSYYKAIGREASLNQTVNVSLQSNSFIQQKMVMLTYNADFTIQQHTVSAMLNTTQTPGLAGAAFYEVSGGYTFLHKKFSVSNTLGAILGSALGNIYNSTRVSYSLSNFKVSILNRLYSGTAQRANIENISQLQFSWCLN